MHVSYRYCAITCGRCPYACANYLLSPPPPVQTQSLCAFLAASQPPLSPCAGCKSDVPPDTQYTCAQQKSFGKVLPLPDTCMQRCLCCVRFGLPLRCAALPCCCRHHFFCCCVDLSWG